MYIPEWFRETRLEVLHELIRRHSFGVVVSTQEGALVASHLPFVLEADHGPYGRLVGHMARANGQWRGFEEGREVLVIFSGPHAYVSPTWYQIAPSVPTWNYAVVHAYGVPRLVENGPALLRILHTMVQEFEPPSDQAWNLAAMPDEYTARMMKGIVGFEIEVTRLEGKLKLSQNRSAADREAVIRALQDHVDADAAAVAELMRATLDA